MTPVSQTFHGRDIFAPLAAFLANGHQAEEIGPACKKNELITIEKTPPRIDRESNTIYGEIISIDHFGNLTTNITSNTLSQFSTNVKEISLQLNNHVIRGLQQNYAQTTTDKALLIINSNGFLEISINCGNAAKMMCAKLQDSVKLFINK